MEFSILIIGENIGSPMERSPSLRLTDANTGLLAGWSWIIWQRLRQRGTTTGSAAKRSHRNTRNDNICVGVNQSPRSLVTAADGRGGEQYNNNLIDRSARVRTRWKKLGAKRRRTDNQTWMRIPGEHLRRRRRP